MLKTIADLSPQLIAFTLSLQLSLSCSQLRHVTQVADALITTEGSKTLSAKKGECPVQRRSGQSNLCDVSARIDPNLNFDFGLLETCGVVFALKP